jgi:hypothetical protein
MSPAERHARNEILFREANEQIRRVQKELDLPDGEMPFLCECADEGCREVIRLTPDEYEGVRSRARCFVVASGHDSENVVTRHERYHVVQKTGREGELVEAADPREGA